MSVVKPRNRQVCVRFSQDEYQALCAYCQTQGARSISDLARSILCKAAFEGNPSSGAIPTEIKLLKKQLRILDGRVEHLSQCLASIAPPACG